MCKRRRPCYKRTYSGDLLCEVCLERALLKAVKRAVGRYKVLEPRSRVLVPITYTAPHLSAALALVITKLEAKFSTEVIIARPKDIALDEVKGWPPEGSKEVLVDVIKDGVKTNSPSACIRFDRRWSLSLARELGVKAVALPFSRTDLIILSLNALLVEGIEALSESLDLIEVDGVKFFSAFSAVEGEIVSAYVATRSLWFYSDFCEYEVPARKVFFSVAGRRPELEFSRDKTLVPIQRKVAERLHRCKLCGGFVREGELCSYCSSARVEVRILGSPPSPRGTS